ncbi:MAG TPA: hypothetical protein VG147_10380 [Solirubrobacteraceae bacterium]|nr:hypothetical protein [Solirubrobacteraceae bacterium]
MRSPAAIASLTGRRFAGCGGAPVGLDQSGLTGGEPEGAGGLASCLFAGGGCGCDATEEVCGRGRVRV